MEGGEAPCLPSINPTTVNPFGGIALGVATLAALAAANTPFGLQYAALLDTSAKSGSGRPYSRKSRTLDQRRADGIVFSPGGIGDQT